MTKSEFVDQVANRADLGKNEAGKAVDAVLDVIQDALQRGSDITFSGFGKFHVAERGARQGVHPRTGEPIQISASKVPRFSTSSRVEYSTGTICTANPPSATLACRAWA